jgi:hypothetical protein
MATLDAVNSARGERFTMKVRHQRGYIFETGRGVNRTFHVRYYRTVSEDGIEKRVQKSERLCLRDAKRHSKTCKAVKDLAAGVMDRINKESGKVVSNTDIRVVDYFVDPYLKYCKVGYETVGMKPSTVREKIYIFEQHLRSEFGDTALSEYTHRMAMGFVNRKKTTLSKTTLKHIRAMASAMLSEAI